MIRIVYNFKVVAFFGSLTAAMMTSPLAYAQTSGQLFDAVASIDASGSMSSYFNSVSTMVTGLATRLDALGVSGSYGLTTFGNGNLTNTNPGGYKYDTGNPWTYTGGGLFGASSEFTTLINGAKTTVGYGGTYHADAYAGVDSVVTNYTSSLRTGTSANVIFATDTYREAVISSKTESEIISALSGKYKATAIIQVTITDPSGKDVAVAYKDSSGQLYGFLTSDGSLVKLNSNAISAGYYSGSTYSSDILSFANIALASGGAVVNINKVSSSTTISSLISALLSVNSLPSGSIDTAQAYYKETDSVATGSAVIFNGGTLKLTSGNYTTSAAVTVGSTGGVIDTNGYTANISGTLGGTGDLIKMGKGELRFTGSNIQAQGSLSGALTVLQGGVFANPSHYPSSIILGNTGGDFGYVGFALGTDSTYSGVISGEGTVVISNPFSAVTTFTGINTYAGTTYINGGTLKLSGQGSLSNSSGLAFAPNVNSPGGTSYGTFDLNGKTQTLSFLLTTTDDATVAPGGTLAINGGALTVDQIRNTTFAGAITGQGSFTKAGTGSLTLSGTSTFSGTTTVNGGTLAVSGSLPSAITVASGGVLQIPGGVVGSVSNSGVLAGDSSAMSTMRVSGNFTQTAGGVLAVKIAPSGASDKLVVGGTANLNGTLAVLPESGSYAAGTTYAVVEAGSVSGTFSQVTGAVPGLNITPVYSATGVSLVLVNPVNTAALVAEATSQSVTETGQAQARSTVRNTVSAVSTRLQNVFSGRAGVRAASAEGRQSGMSAGDEDPWSGVSVWTDVSASRLINSVTANKFDGWSQNLLFGADKMLDADWIVGAVVGVEHSNLSTSLLNGKRKAAGGSLTAYAGYKIDDNFNVNVQFGLGALSNSLRQNAFGVSGRDTFSSWRVMTALNLNSTWKAGDFDLSTLTGLSYAHDRYASYDNTSGTRVSPGPSRLAQARIGGEVAYNLDETYQPYFSATYEGDISTNGEGDRHGAILGGGARAFISENLTAGLMGTAQVFRKNDNVYSAFANVRYTF